MIEDESDEEPNDPKTLRKKGIRLHSKGEFDEALDAFKDALELNPEGPEAWLIWLKKGMTFRYQRKYNEALDAFDKALELNPNGLNTWRIWQCKGFTFHSLQKYSEAVESFNRAIQINPCLPELWQNKADYLYLMDRLKEAKECFIRAETLCSELKGVEFGNKTQQDAEIFASIFIDTITAGQEPFSQLRSALKARGFLLVDELEDNYYPERIFLSDNSHKQDALYLDKLLKKKKIGYIFSDDSTYMNRQYQEGSRPLPFQTWEVIITAEISKNKLNFFTVKHGGGETGNIATYSNCEHDFETFKKRTHGPKIEVYGLDPYIARLVKTLNAIGIATHYSCDGNVWRPNGKKLSAFIQLKCVYDSIWLAILMDKCVIPKRKLTNKWQIGELPNLVNTLIMSPTNGWLSLYLDIYNVAEILYKNRFNLRDYKHEYFARLSEEKFIHRAKEDYKDSSMFSSEFSNYIFAKVPKKYYEMDDKSESY